VPEAHPPEDARTNVVAEDDDVSLEEHAAPSTLRATIGATTDNHFTFMAEVIGVSYENPEPTNQNGTEDPRTEGYSV
jgi:hypothetical protein